MTFKSMAFKKRLPTGEIVWADIQIGTIQTPEGIFDVARVIAIDIPKLLPMTVFLTQFNDEFIRSKINPQIEWSMLELIEVQLKPKGLILTIN
jgi:hypothetical protein